MVSDLTQVLNTIAKYNYNTIIHTHKQIKLHNARSQADYLISHAFQLKQNLRK